MFELRNEEQRENNFSNIDVFPKLYFTIIIDVEGAFCPPSRWNIWHFLKSRYCFFFNKWSVNEGASLRARYLLLFTIYEHI